MSCEFAIYWMGRDRPVSERWFRILGNLGSGWYQNHGSPDCPHGHEPVEPPLWTRKGREMQRRAAEFRREVRAARDQ